MHQDDTSIRRRAAITYPVINPAMDSGRARPDGLTRAERQLYRAIVRSFPERGGPGDWLRAEATKHGVDLDGVLARLEQRDLIVRDPATGAITVAYPFSLRPTRHRVELEDKRSVYAMCAIDALGIPFMLDRPATIVSTDPMSGKPIRVEVRDAKARWNPPDAVVFAGSVDTTGPAAQACCGVINFFESRESAETYQRAHPEVHGCVLTQTEAVTCAKRTFGSLFEGP